MSDALTTEYERWCDAFHEGSDAVKRIAQETLDLRAEVERLEALEATYAWMPFEVAVLSIGDRSFSVDPDVIAEFERLKAIADGHVQATEISVIAAEAQGVCVGREQAAKIAKDHSHQHPRDLLPSIIAAAIQAKKEQLYE